jgi:hypothetical protein
MVEKDKLSPRYLEEGLTVDKLGKVALEVLGIKQ